MLHFALLGEKLGHSLSVPIHMHLYRRLGLSADYRLVEIPRDRFEEEAAQALQTFHGLNVTIPYKQAIMPLLDGVDSRAAAIGAVNTVTTHGERCGHNTDAAGFIGMLRHAGIDPAGKPCYCLGSGGASKAAVYALREMGAASVTVVSRHPEGDEIGYEQLCREFEGVLVNCTPAGMFPHPEGCPISDDALGSVMRRATGVADMIYNPPQTRLTAAAAACGVPACTGLYMLVRQAVEAEKLWLERDLPSGMTEDLMRDLNG